MVLFVTENLALAFPALDGAHGFWRKWWYPNSFARRRVPEGLPKYADQSVESGIE